MASLAQVLLGLLLAPALAAPGCAVSFVSGTSTSVSYFAHRENLAEGTMYWYSKNAKLEVLWSRPDPDGTSQQFRVVCLGPSKGYAIKQAVSPAGVTTVTQCIPSWEKIGGCAGWSTLCVGEATATDPRCKTSLLVFPHANGTATWNGHTVSTFYNDRQVVAVDIGNGCLPVASGSDGVLYNFIDSFGPLLPVPEDAFDIPDACQSTAMFSEVPILP